MRFSAASRSDIERLFLLPPPDGTNASLHRIAANRVTARDAVIGFGVEMRARRSTACALALAGLLAGCGQEEDHANRERPAASINVTAAIIDGRVNVSPERFGAGPIRLIVTNQTDSEQAVTIETGGNDPGITETSDPIIPSGTTTMEVDVPEGGYSIATEDGAIEPASVTVGKARASAQHQLLQP
jgi:hypothetical protein